MPLPALPSSAMQSHPLNWPSARKLFRRRSRTRAMVMIATTLAAVLLGVFAFSRAG